MQRDAALVLETTEITPGVFVTWYDAPSLAAGATPGQFVMVDPGWEAGSPRPAAAARLFLLPLSPDRRG